MEKETQRQNIGLVLLDKTAQVVEEFNLSDNPQYKQKIFHTKLSLLEKEMNHLLPELKIKDLPLFNNLISLSFELGVVSAAYNQKGADLRDNISPKNNLSIKENTRIKTENENPITG